MRLLPLSGSSLFILGLSLMLSGCASGPPVPQWQMNAKSGIELSISAYLAGNDRVESAEFSNARSELASTGQLALVARAELVRCASRVASLVFDSCPQFEALRQDASAAERAYADYLAGRIESQEIAQLPAQQAAVASSGADAVATTIAGISDPFSRLVAAGVALRSGRADPAVITLAIDTASAQGWRRPLLAWLGVNATRAEKSGDLAEAQRLRRRIDLVGQSRP
jgi:hypothetical protein